MKKIMACAYEDDNGDFYVTEEEITEYDIYFLFKNNVIIYIGLTSNIERRLLEHKKTRDFDSYMIWWSETNRMKAQEMERNCIILLGNFPNSRLENKLNNQGLKYREIIKMED